jgi:4-diphosphocytidyl-2-C-methyl-D-erythritol kinase
MPTRVRSHAKINLGLGIGAPRADGFHSLVTVYQTLEIHDIVTVSARLADATSIRLTSNDERVPTDERNTAWKMVELALQVLERKAEVEIHIEKSLPVQGGLGAGSANAVAALVGLENEVGGIPGLNHPTDEDLSVGTPVKIEPWGTRLVGLENELEAQFPSHPSSTERSKDGARELGSGSASQQVSESASQRTDRFIPPFEQQKLEGWGSQFHGFLQRRLELAAQVGSDVPLFLIGGTVLGVDRGQEVYPLPGIEPTWCVIALPAVAVSTPQAFRDWDALCAERGLTAEASDYKLKRLSRAYSSAFAGGIQRGGDAAGSSGVLFKNEFREEDLAGPQESALVRTGISGWIENDFEQVVFRQHPSLAEIKRILASAGTPEAALHASLSGSGSALYGLYLTRGDAEAAETRLKQAGVRSHLTRTLPRQAYWAQMLQDFEH